MSDHEKNTLSPGSLDALTGATAIVADVLSALSIPGGSLLSTTINSLVAKKRRFATDILAEELKDGFHGEIDWDAHDIDPLAGCIMRLSKAVDYGTAKENLRLIAQVISGLKSRNTLSEDKFSRWCSVLEQLNREELVAIGHAFRIAKDIQTRETSNFGQEIRQVMKENGFEDVDLILTSLARTGLIAIGSAWGGIAYNPTPWLLELGDLANLEKIDAK